MPILKLKPACKDYLWGGRRLIDEFGKQTHASRMAESWELSCHPDGLSVIDGGAFDGRTLRDYLACQGRHVLGDNCLERRDFPLLIKLIDAREALSVQVHPDDADAMAHEGQSGKTELWVILDAAPGAFLYCGFTRALSREEFARHIQDNTLPEVLRRVYVQPGDVVYIPAGTLHAIGAGILIAEIQQSSNVTYRVYDYDRRDAQGQPRALHIPQALRVTRREPPAPTPDWGGHLARCDYFTVDRRQAPWSEDCGGQSFVSLLVLAGTGTLTCGPDSLPCRKGESFFLPAGSGRFSVSGGAEALVTRAGRV